MSFFLAKVPEGTHLYHGTWKPGPIQGTEWLAFEPEHALLFARSRSPPQRDPPDGHPTEPMGSSHHRNRQYPLQVPNYESGPEPNPEPSTPGYLHTYTPTHPLHLLYIDGMSAGKTSNGTLDTQDYVLVNLSDSKRGGMVGEFERAHTLCNLSATVWQHKIDGVIRMEGGFEIILCDFERDLELQEIIPVRESEAGNGRRMGMLGGWRYYKAITDRYHGIGGSRVTLDYDYFVSAFEDAIPAMWDNDVQSDIAMPRLENVADGHLVKIRDRVTQMIVASNREGTKKEKGVGTNWQEVIDMIVERYTAPLHYLGNASSPVRTSEEELGTYLASLLRPFIDYTLRNTTREVQRCVSQFLPSSMDDATLAARAVQSVTHRICSTLLVSLDTSILSLSKSSLADSLAHINALVRYLQWTTWKQCLSCNDEEICMTPIWPMGTHEDHRAPSCLKESDVVGRGGYWGTMMGRPPPERWDEGVQGVGKTPRA
ncbi:hypothetical protein BCR34DRAFT_496011 [Clohesyomyces aquaticus]|uniref:Uncharacterized protein n=1 Tax=Clohesyomyces aquaticus TaxID=1231657 RepID=A0A1Y1YKR6_9PLEO|nr:hypothetical protein BCR34DRAFT_496011 [Clohesyomyces aquaticus]